MKPPETVDKLLKDINKETGLPWHWHSTVVEHPPIGLAHRIVCEIPVRGGSRSQYKWFQVQDNLLPYMNDYIVRYLKEEIDKVRKGE